MKSWDGIEFVMTEKIDGTSATYILNENEFMVCSRNQWLKEDETNVYWRIAKELDIEKKMRDLFEEIGNFAIQGEIVGPGIQSNRLKLDKLSFFVFNIYSIVQRKYLSWQLIEEFNKELGFQLVPILGTGFVFSKDLSIDSLIAMADGSSLLNPKVLREGVVYRSYYGCPDEIFGKVSFKIVSNKYLLKTGE
jgi:RNA ligase (TIGR02306 family)